jgi:hypothetical protein
MLIRWGKRSLSVHCVCTGYQPGVQFGTYVAA